MAYEKNNIQNIRAGGKSFFGVSSMIDKLATVGMLKPMEALKTADPDKWHYGNSFDPKKIENNYSSFAKILIELDVKILWMTPENNKIADSIFTYDASFMTPKGAILLLPGKPLRKGEEKIHEAFYKKNNIPIIGKLSGLAIAEGGDMFWLDKETLVIGKGFRTNQEGIEQIKRVLSALNVKVVPFDLPFFKGPDACLHVMSLISIVDKNKALTYSPLLPIGLVQLLEKKGYNLIEAPEDEFISSEGLNINVLAIEPGVCVMISGFPKTKEALEKNGVKVYTFNGDSLCIGCEGGPTCLTRPILRKIS